MKHRADCLWQQGFLLSFIITVMAYEGRYPVIRKSNRQKLRGDRRLGTGASPCRPPPPAPTPAPGLTLDLPCASHNERQYMPEVNRINSTVLGFVGPKARRYTAEHVERFVV